METYLLSESPKLWLETLTWNERVSIVLFLVKTAPPLCHEVIQVHAAILWNNLEIQLSALDMSALTYFRDPAIENKNKKFSFIYWQLSLLQNEVFLFIKDFWSIFKYLF